MANNAAKAKEAIRKEGDRLEADLIRLSKAHSVAEGKEAFCESERGRLGRQVLRTRSGLVSQQKLVLEKRAEAERSFGRSSRTQTYQWTPRDCSGQYLQYYFWGH